VLVELSRGGVTSVTLMVADGALAPEFGAPAGMGVAFRGVGRGAGLEDAARAVGMETGGPVTVVDGAAVFRKGLVGDLVALPVAGGEGLMVRGGAPAMVRLGRGVSAETLLREEDAAGRAWVLRTAEDVRTAKWVLLNGLRKPMLIDGVVGYYFMRPITLRITSVLADTRVTPNCVTAFCFVLGLAGAALVGLASAPWMMALGVVLYFAGATLDCVDGEMARVKYLASYTGAWFDTLSDDISTAALLAALGIYLHRTTGQDWPLWLGLAASGGFMAGEIYVYYYLATVFKSGDVLDFVWVFAEGKGKRPAAQQGGIVPYLLLFAKRDFFSAFLALCALSGLIAVGAAVVSAACVCYTGVVFYDAAVVLSRGGRERPA